jgi:hypothetical protein
MSDEKPLETYTPRRTHHLSVEEELPHSDEPRTLQYQLKEGTTYDVLEGEEADKKLGRAPVNNVTGCVRRSALPDHAS